MNLYLIESNNNSSCAYNSIIVCAKSTKDAKTISPDEYHILINNEWYFKTMQGNIKESFSDWNKIDKLIVTYLGKASNKIERGLILDSRNSE